MIIIELPCTLADLETAIHKHGDTHGYDGFVYTKGPELVYVKKKETVKQKFEQTTFCFEE